MKWRLCSPCGECAGSTHVEQRTTPTAIFPGQRNNIDQQRKATDGVGRWSLRDNWADKKTQPYCRCLVEFCRFHHASGAKEEDKLRIQRQLADSCWRQSSLRCATGFSPSLQAPAHETSISAGVRSSEVCISLQTRAPANLICHTTNPDKLHPNSRTVMLIFVCRLKAMRVNAAIETSWLKCFRGTIDHDTRLSPCCHDKHWSTPIQQERRSALQSALVCSFKSTMHVSKC